MVRINGDARDGQRGERRDDWPDSGRDARCRCGQYETHAERTPRQVVQEEHIVDSLVGWHTYDDDVSVPRGAASRGLIIPPRVTVGYGVRGFRRP